VPGIAVYLSTAAAAAAAATATAAAAAPRPQLCGSDTQGWYFFFMYPILTWHRIVVCIIDEKIARRVTFADSTSNACRNWIEILHTCDKFSIENKRDMKYLYFKDTRKICLNIPPIIDIEKLENVFFFPFLLFNYSTFPFNENFARNYNFILMFGSKYYYQLNLRQKSGWN